MESSYDALARGLGDGERSVSRDASRCSSVSSMHSRSALSGSSRSTEIRDVSCLDVDTTAISSPALWLPYTLRTPFLLLMALTSLAIAIVLAVLRWYSEKYDGIADDNGSATLYFAWRYVPTIVAVLFTQSCVMLAADIKRTEPFARMAGPKPPEARHTLLYTPKAWWKSLYNALSQKEKRSPRAWPLALSSFAAIFSSLVISSLSSSVFTTAEVLTPKSVPMLRYSFGQDDRIPLVPRRETYSRTISAFLRNTTTSMWVSDSYVVLPFMPAADSKETSNVPQDGVWEAETKVLEMTSECRPMTLSDKRTANVTLSSSKQSGYAVSSRGIRLVSEDGCSVQMQSPLATEAEVDGLAKSAFTLIPGSGFADDFVEYGGALWTNMSDAYVSWIDLVEEQGRFPNISGRTDDLSSQWTQTFIYNLSSQCRGRDLLLVTPPWYTKYIPASINGEAEEQAFQDRYWANFSVQAQICSPAYFVADVNVTASIAGSDSRIAFDNTLFRQRRTQVSNQSVDFAHLDNLSFRKDWSKYLIDTAPSGQSDYDATHSGGAAMLLAKLFSFNTTEMMLNTTLGTESGRLRRRFLHELLFSSTTSVDPPEMEPITGDIVQAQKKIVVIQDVAIALIVTTALGACYFATMLWCIATHRRPLGLRSDPATISGAINLLQAESTTRAHLRALTDRREADFESVLGSRLYTLKEGTIVEQQNLRVTSQNSPLLASRRRIPSVFPKKDSEKTSQSDWRPYIFRMRWSTALLVSLVAIIVTLLVLRSYSRRNQLIQSVFVSQTELGLFNITFSPHSIMATLIAVSVGLCWEAIDRPMRHLQPYLSMSRNPVPIHKGLDLSYQSTYWAWAAVKAALQKHWTLSLVTTGTTLSQILVISMAAIFERQTITRESSIPMRQPFIMRQSPLTFDIDLGMRPFYLSAGLLTGDSDWLSTALDEITLNTTPLAWTKDEWFFVPVYTRDSTNSLSGETTSSRPQSQDIKNYGSLAVNMTSTTSALRGKVDCRPLVPEAEWLDRAEDLFADDPIFRNRTFENITGYVLPTKLFVNKTNEVPIFTVPRRMACCTNSTSLDSPSAVAYWSNNSTMNEEQEAEPVDETESKDSIVTGTWPRDFAVKWIVGPSATTPISGEEKFMIDSSVGDSNETLLYYPEEPQIAILYCTPIIEHANVSITFAGTSGQVYSFELLEEPQPALGAWEHAYDIVYDEPMSNNSGGNVSYGSLFMSQMLTAPHIIPKDRVSSWLVENRTIEDVTSEHFNVRDIDRGLNMDFMSYATLHLAGMNSTIPLDPEKLYQYSHKAFQTFFKHFAATGHWSYGHPGYAEATVTEHYQDWWGDDSLGYEMGLQINGTLTDLIVVLSMNELAMWLSISITATLILILVSLIVTFRLGYPKTSLKYPIECLADVLSLVVGSDDLMRAVNMANLQDLEKSGLETRLSWFRDNRGDVRWGIEATNSDVEWVS